MNISVEDIVYLIICGIEIILSFKWIKCVYKYCFNDKYKRVVQKMNARLLYEFITALVPIPILVGILSIILSIIIVVS
jgi:hypothetical protein